ncbi:MAG: hypothetical protein EBV84_10840, partial [Betaproteobacteria bacterium]|nr:hypothetical protein [Betaproteobacteria bacterium]
MSTLVRMLTFAGAWSRLETSCVCLLAVIRYLSDIAAEDLQEAMRMIRKGPLMLGAAFLGLTGVAGAILLADQPS